MTRYFKQTRMLVSVDCIIFGNDGRDIKLLLIQRGFEPDQSHWSLMGGFVESNESVDRAANRVLKQLTGLEKVYLEQLHAFGDVHRDPLERVTSIAYFSLIDISRYEQQISHEYHAKWFDLKNIPPLILDHIEMIESAKERLRYKAAFHPILFELLPDRFTIPQLVNLYEEVYETMMDKRNFSRKLKSTGLLIKQKQKEKENSKKGAYYYRLDKKKTPLSF